MKNFFLHRWFLLALRLLIGGVFLYSGAIKIADPTAFSDSIASFDMLPPPLINLVALALPPFEIITGAMLLLGLYQRQAATSLLFLTVLFALALGQALFRGLEVDCGCFGSGEPSVWRTWLSLGRDLLLMAGCAWLRFKGEPGSPSPFGSPVKEEEAALLGR